MSSGTLKARDGRTSVDKAISVMQAFGDDAHLGVSELARRTGLSKSTTFRLLGMLERNAVVERAGTAYRLGRAMEELGAQASTPGQDRMRDLLTPFLADLYELTHATAKLAVLSGTNVVYLNKLEGHQRVRTPGRIGGRTPAYCTAAGKVLLAHDAEALEETLRMPRHAWTATTLVDATELRSELDRVRATGMAIDRGEVLPTLTCIAVPVMGSDGKPIAALSLSGEASTFRPETYEKILRRICFAASRAVSRTRVPAAA